MKKKTIHQTIFVVNIAIINPQSFLGPIGPLELGLELLVCVLVILVELELVESFNY